MKIKLTYPNILLLAATLSTAFGVIVFAASYPYRGTVIYDLFWALFTMAVMAALTAFMHRFRLAVWLTVTLVGYIVGLVSAAQLLAIPNVIGGYPVAILTVATFAGHGLVIGMFAEVIVWMHHVTHGLLGRMMKDEAGLLRKSEGDEKVRLPENRV